MYAIKSNNEIAGYADSFVYIRLHTNGCYVLCNKEEAEGICVKIAKKFKNDETGETITQISDTVFRLTDNGLHGTEPKCGCELGSGAQVRANKDAEINNILAELETEAGI